MLNKQAKKIRIIGSVGSGKTTLARGLSSTLKIPYYELDSMVWKRGKNGDTRRTEEERIECLNKIIGSETWIMEGVHNEEWVSSSFQHADIIIFLDIHYQVRTYRIIKRFALQKLGMESSNYKPTFSIFFKMFKWNRFFEDIGKPHFYERFGIYTNKIIMIKNNKELKQLIMRMKEVTP
jgi:adenylate kinase family enzyme